MTSQPSKEMVEAALHAYYGPAEIKCDDLRIRMSAALAAALSQARPAKDVERCALCDRTTSCGKGCPAISCSFCGDGGFFGCDGRCNAAKKRKSTVSALPANPDEGYHITWDKNGKRIATPLDQTVTATNRAEIAMAVTRGWCSPKNQHKEMDADLALAIVNEVMRSLSPEAGKKEDCPACKREPALFYNCFRKSEDCPQQSSRSPKAGKKVAAPSWENITEAQFEAGAKQIQHEFGVTITSAHQALLKAITAIQVEAGKKEDGK